MVSCFLQARPKCPDVGSRGGLRALLLLLLPFLPLLDRSRRELDDKEVPRRVAANGGRRMDQRD